MADKEQYETEGAPVQETEPTPTGDVDPTEVAGYQGDEGTTGEQDFRVQQGKGYAAPVAAEGEQVETGGPEQVSGPVGGDGEGGPARNTSAAPPDWTGARY